VREGNDYTFWVYILTSRTGTLYIGITGYIDQRISQHKMDSIEGFTKKYKVHRLVYYETFGYVLNAIRREKQLKGWRREKKIALIEKSNPRWQDLSEHWGRECGFGDSPSKLPDATELCKCLRDPSTPRRSAMSIKGFPWRFALSKPRYALFLYCAPDARRRIGFAAL
jgi:putative endonuclease